MASIRREIRIRGSADEVWAVVGDVGTIHHWFPGIVACTVAEDAEGTVRTVTLGSGMQLVERIVTNDPLARRFQYRITGGVFREHLGTIDVIDLGDGTSLAVYGTDAVPAVMGLVIGGASGVALENLQRLVEGGGPAAGRSTHGAPTEEAPR
jgi:Polyketide cyclase / dehydrase and lipid transport